MAELLAQGFFRHDARLTPKSSSVGNGNGNGAGPAASPFFGEEGGAAGAAVKGAEEDDNHAAYEAAEVWVRGWARMSSVAWVVASCVVV